MTKEEIERMVLKSYLLALNDTNKIIQEVMEKSIDFYEQKIKQMEDKT